MQCNVRDEISEDEMLRYFYCYILKNFFFLNKHIVQVFKIILIYLLGFSPSLIKIPSLIYFLSGVSFFARLYQHSYCRDSFMNVTAQLVLTVFKISFEFYDDMFFSFKTETICSTFQKLVKLCLKVTLHHQNIN